MRWPYVVVVGAVVWMTGCLPQVVPPSAGEYASDAGDVSSDTSLDAADAAPCQDAPECTEQGAFCGPGVLDRFYCELDAQGCLVKVSDACELGSACDQGECRDCTDTACEGFEADQILGCIPGADGDVAQYSACRRDKVTGCLMPRVQTCAMGQVCALGGPFDDPCSDPLDG